MAQGVNIGLEIYITMLGVSDEDTADRISVMLPCKPVAKKNPRPLSLGFRFFIKNLYFISE
jgi:hypothetical protein